jgi:hypothetical protein
MTDTFRALCAELLDIATAHCNPDDYAVGYCAAVLDRARAALAHPEPVAQEVMTVNELAAIIYEVDPRTDTLCSPCMSSEDLAEGLLSHPRFHAPSTAPAIQPVPVAPTDETKEAMISALNTLEGWDNFDHWVWPVSALEQSKKNTTESLQMLRAVLVRWGAPANNTRGTH